MSRAILRATFPGIKLCIIERKKNPCRTTTLQHHYYAGYKLAVIQTGIEDPPINRRHFWAKLVRVRPSWNEAIKDASKRDFRDCFITMEPDEVILNVTHAAGWSNGVGGDIITFVFHSTVDGFERTHSVLIPYAAQMQAVPPHI